MKKSSERGVETDAQGARTQRRDLLAPGAKRRPQGETVAAHIGDIGDAKAHAKTLGAHAQQRAGVEVIALRRAEFSENVSARSR